MVLRERARKSGLKLAQDTFDIGRQHRSHLDLLVAAAFRRWKLCMLLGFLGALAGAMLSLPIAKTYRASALVTMAPGDSVTTPSSLSVSALGGLAALAGLPPVPGSDRSEALAVLQSDTFLTYFIQKHDLLPDLYPDSIYRRWLTPGQPSVKDAVRRFRQHALEIQDDRRTGLISISLVWPAQDQAHIVANAMVRDVNNILRERKIAESEARVAAIQNQLESTSAVAVRTALLSLLEQELKLGTLARTREDFALVVLDPAQPADEHDRVAPQRFVWAAGGAAVTGLLLLALLHFRVIDPRSPAE